VVTEQESPSETRERTASLTVKLRRTALALALATGLVAIYVFTQVPMSTSISYERLSRSADIPVISLLLPPVLLLMNWFQGRKIGQDEALTPAQRKFVLPMAAGLLFVGLVAAELFLSWEYLRAGRG